MLYGADVIEKQMVLHNQFLFIITVDRILMNRWIDPFVKLKLCKQFNRADLKTCHLFIPFVVHSLALFVSLHPLVNSLVIP